jgi:hypothetical protein
MSFDGSTGEQPELVLVQPMVIGPLVAMEVDGADEQSLPGPYVEPI